jgi:hypothetical protein
MKKLQVIKTIHWVNNKSQKSHFWDQWRHNKSHLKSKSFPWKLFKQCTQKLNPANNKNEKTRNIKFQYFYNVISWFYSTNIDFSRFLKDSRIRLYYMNILLWKSIINENCLKSFIKKVRGYSRVIYRNNNFYWELLCVEDQN